MRRRLPPLNALKAFEAAARLESFSRAADELCVTRGAIGQQIKALEDYLGVELFDRSSHRIRLAPAGQSLLPVATYALDALAQEAAKLRKSGLQGRITVAAAPAFGSKWLLSHLADFLQVHPEIDVRVESLLVYSQELPADCDLAIAYGFGDGEDHLVQQLGPSYYAPICSPRLLNSVSKAIRAASDLDALRLIHDDDGSRWRRWLSAAQAPTVNPMKGLFLDNFVYAIDAALAGLGVILADPITTGADLKSGNLVRILDDFYPDKGGYSIVIPHAKRANPLVMAFHSWLTKESLLGRAAGADFYWGPAKGDKA